MNRRILNIAIPSIISNVIIPLLGLFDLTIAGHLGVTAFIGAVSVGATMFNLTYWNFGFLRMGTSGMTAQAFGRKDFKESYAILFRSTLTALFFGLVVIALQYPIQWILLKLIGPGVEVQTYVRDYFFVVVWGAPAILATMSMSGWMLGMQNSVYPMIVSISVNIVNIIVSLLCVYAFDMGFVGIAYGTMAAQWFGFLFSVVLLVRMTRKHDISIDFKQTLKAVRELHGFSQYSKVNVFIFLRSLCMMLVTLFFTSAGARSGDLVLAVNALLMQLYIFYSYFMDGFAFAGEALVGKYFGAKDKAEMQRCIRHLFYWGATVMAIFVGGFLLFRDNVIALLTNDAAVIELATKYSIWAALIPMAGMMAFIWDGVFIGLTATKGMFLSLLGGTVTFFTIYFGLPYLITSEGVFADRNNVLWLAFLSFLMVRGLVQCVIIPKFNKVD